jgi:hypothetical protein
VPPEGQLVTNQEGQFAAQQEGQLVTPLEGQLAAPQEVRLVAQLEGCIDYLSYISFSHSFHPFPFST